MPEVLDKYTIKRVLKERRIYAYEIAEEMHLCESALSKRLRNPTAEQVKEILQIIDKISKR
jgi:predicted transcriptional regulator